MNQIINAKIKLTILYIVDTNDGDVGAKTRDQQRYGPGSGVGA